MRLGDRGVLRKNRLNYENRNQVFLSENVCCVIICSMIRNKLTGEVSESVGSVLRACQILQIFRDDEELLRLKDVVERTGTSKTTAYRLLMTLEQGGVLERAGPARFRRRFRPVEHRVIRIGFAGQTSNSTFSRLVSEGIRAAALAYGVELVEVDNRYSAKIALKNADMLIARNVDLVLEFQGYENVAPIIASRFLQAGIPVIAIEIPHPGATFFGPNNYQAGLIGGRALAKWTKANWNGQVDEVILLEERIAGPLPCSRVTGMLAGIRAGLPLIQESMITTFDGKGSYHHSLEVVRKHLQRGLKRRTLVAANNDPSALGALSAFRECGCAEHCAVVSQNSIPEAREELRRRGSRLIGSVAYFPERYGDQLIPLALSIIRGTSAPSAVFVKHILLTAQNVNRLYPKDVAQTF